MGLYTRADVELSTLEKCEKLRELKEKEQREMFGLLAQKTEALLSTSTLKDHSFFGVFPMITKNNMLLLVIARVPSIEKSTVYQPFYRNATIEVIDPETFVPLAIHKRIAFLYFEIKGQNVHAVDICTVPEMRRQGIGTFMLRLLESIATGFGAKIIDGELSPVDLPNREIQIAFYTKNGYNIFFRDENKESGWIEKKLSR